MYIVKYYVGWALATSERQRGMVYNIIRALIFILIATTFFGCSSDEGKEQFNLDVGFELSIKDSEGNDLLNPANPNSFNKSELRLFYLIDGNIIEVYDANMDYPRNFMIYQGASGYRIGITNSG